jgi:hypothetical protein
MSYGIGSIPLISTGNSMSILFPDYASGMLPIPYDILFPVDISGMLPIPYDILFPVEAYHLYQQEIVCHMV